MKGLTWICIFWPSEFKFCLFFKIININTLLIQCVSKYHAMILNPLMSENKHAFFWWKYWAQCWLSSWFFANFHDSKKILYLKKEALMYLSFQFLNIGFEPINLVIPIFFEFHTFRRFSLIIVVKLLILYDIF